MNNDFTTKNIQAYEIHILQTFKQALLMNPPENSASLISLTINGWASAV